MKFEDWGLQHKGEAITPQLDAEKVLEIGEKGIFQYVAEKSGKTITRGIKPNPKADRHMEICEKLNEIYRAKNEAYGDSFGETYRKLGIISAITRMTDKMNRLTALCTGAQNNVQDESIRDTALDLANYSIMLVIEMDDEKRRGK